MLFCQLKKCLNAKGLTLIEVIASIAIISLILLTFSSFFFSSSKQANRNTDKLVVSHLADGYFERLRVLEPENIYAKDSIKMNNRTYCVTVTPASTDADKNLSLSNYVVTVTSSATSVSGTVEGYLRGISEIETAPTYSNDCD